MRILWISQMLPYLPCHDGFRVIPAKLIEQLSRRHEIHLVTADDDPQDAAHLDWPARYCASVRTASMHASSTHPPLVETVRDAVEATRPDIVQLEGAGIAHLASDLPVGLPRVLCAHDSLSLRYRDFAAMPGSVIARLRWLARSFRARRFERKYFALSDKVVVTSPADSNWLAQRVRLPHPPLVIPNGVDPEALSSPPSPVRGRIVFTGSMNWPPNEDAAIFFARQAFPAIRQRVADAEFWIVGANPTARVLELARMDGVHVTGTVPEIRPWVQSAEVYASPVRFGLGVKNKVLEAMALGAPIVATPKSLSGTPLEHGRHVMIADSAESLAENVIALLGSDALRTSLAREARAEAARNYSWPSIVSRFEELYSELARIRSAA